ncbi:5-hydroxymethyl-dUMP N-hydrolase-like [Amphiura filiformis]|uniref:5-hydroxymethyl-dUMP N-hydrolase-like n=1 Tax=Amphiura filiformis TaxID=82378 RepID=UPI003B2241D8
MSHKIYFCGSGDGSHLRIIEKLQTYGQVLTENLHHVDSTNVFDPTTMETGQVRSHQEMHENYVTWLEECNVVVAEVTESTLGVGYEIGRAAAMNKKILCLFRSDNPKHLSCMIQGAHNDSTFIVKHYKEEDVPAILKEFFEKL